MPIVQPIKKRVEPSLEQVGWKEVLEQWQEELQEGASSRRGHATKDIARKKTTPVAPIKTFQPVTRRDLNLNFPRTRPLMRSPTTAPPALDIPPELPEVEVLRRLRQVLRER